MEPKEAFFPIGPVEPNFFIDREEAEILYNSIIHYSEVPFIIGPAGYGKTSLVNYVVKHQMNKEMISYEIKSSTALEDILIFCHKNINGEHQVVSTSTETAASVKVAGVTRTVNTKPSVLGIIDEIFSMMKNKILFLDNVERLSEKERNNLLDLVFSFAGDNKRTLILAGLMSSYQDILGTKREEEDEAYSRRWNPIIVRPIPYYKTTQIFQRGFKALKLEIQEDLVNLLTNICGGELVTIHEIGLNVAITCKKDKRKNISEAIIQKSLLNVPKRWKLNFDEDFEKIKSKTKSSLNLKTKIMFILATSDKQSLRLHEIKEKLQRIKDESNPSRAISTLCRENQLEKVDRGNYRIRSAKYRLYLRMICVAEHKAMYYAISDFSYTTGIKDFLETLGKAFESLVSQLQHQ